MTLRSALGVVCLILWATAWYWCGEPFCRLYARVERSWRLLTSSQRHWSMVAFLTGALFGTYAVLFAINAGNAAVSLVMALVLTPIVAPLVYLWRKVL